MRGTKMVSLALGATLAGGACQMPQDGGSTTEQSQAFKAAVPTHAQVGIQVPGGVMAIYTPTVAEVGDGVGKAWNRTHGIVDQLAVGERAVFYTATKDMSSSINGGVLGILLVIKQIAQLPPSQVTETHRYYGPWTGALDPLTYAFVMDVVDGSDIKYALMAKPKKADDSAYQALLAGNYHPVSPDHGNGALALDADVAQALDPAGDHGTGKIAIRWDNASEPRSVEVAFDKWADKHAEQTIDALYRFREAGDGSGTFEFLVNGDLDGGRDPMKLAKEKLGIVSRWLASGAGRSDVVVTGGDLPIAELHAQECWDDTFTRTFFWDDHGIFPHVGTPDACQIK